MIKDTHKKLFLSENAGIEDIKGFLSEITLMKSVGQHENIVGIVGHSTKLYNKMMLLTEYCSEGNLLDYLRYVICFFILCVGTAIIYQLHIFGRKFRERFSPEQLYSPVQADVVTFSSFEKSPEDIFNFDSKIVDKFTLKDKSLSLSSISQRCSKNLLRTKPSDRPIKYAGPSMQNIIFNRLYDEHALDNQHCQKSCSCNVSYENEANIVNQANRRSSGRMTEKKGKLQPEMLLFAENQAYDQLSPLENCINSNNSIEMKPLQIDENKFNEKSLLLTGTDLLMFAKQIATGMVNQRNLFV